MKVIINGGRNFNLKAAAFEYLDMLHAENPITLVIEGGAIGADTIAREWAFTRKIKFITYHAQWNKYGRAAGHRRNQEMVDLSPDLVITFPGGKGTEDLVNRAKQKKLKIIRVEEHFTLTELPEKTLPLSPPAHTSRAGQNVDKNNKKGKKNAKKNQN